MVVPHRETVFVFLTWSREFVVAAPRPRLIIIEIFTRYPKKSFSMPVQYPAYALLEREMVYSNHIRQLRRKKWEESSRGFLKRCLIAAKVLLVPPLRIFVTGDGSFVEAHIQQTIIEYQTEEKSLASSWTNIQ